MCLTLKIIGDLTSRILCAPMTWHEGVALLNVHVDFYC